MVSYYHCQRKLYVQEGKSKVLVNQRKTFKRGRTSVLCHTDMEGVTESRQMKRNDYAHGGVWNKTVGHDGGTGMLSKYSLESSE